MANPSPPAPPMSEPDEAEAQFYNALREADIVKLMAVWADDEELVCVHPGGPRMVGRSAIRAAFDAIFAQGRIQVQIDRVRRVHSADAAMHSVVERIDVLTEQGPRTAFVLATNVYLRTAFGWRIVAHHASPGTPAEAPEISDAPAVLH